MHTVDTESPCCQCSNRVRLSTLMYKSMHLFLQYLTSSNNTITAKQPTASITTTHPTNPTKATRSYSQQIQHIPHLALPPNTSKTTHQQQWSSSSARSRTTSTSPAWKTDSPSSLLDLVVAALSKPTSKTTSASKSPKSPKSSQSQSSHLHLHLQSALQQSSWHHSHQSLPMPPAQFTPAKHQASETFSTRSPSPLPHRLRARGRRENSCQL